MKVWITKYALTQGIFEAEASECKGFDGMIEVANRYSYEFYHGEGKDWCRTKEYAISRAEEMRKKKISSLKAQIEKLENMKFE